MELLRVLPGVVVDSNIGESTGQLPRTSQNYTVNGIRSSGNTAQLDGSNLLDIGCNCGMMVSMNNDMVQEVKVQSSNFAAEYGAGGMNVSAVTKAGTSSFHGVGYYYPRDSKFAANDRSNSIPASTSRRRAKVPRLQRRRPDLLRRQLHEEQGQAVLLRRLRMAAAEDRLGQPLLAHVLGRDEERRLQRAARESRLNQNRAIAALTKGPSDHGPDSWNSAGFPGRRPGAEQQHARRT